MGVIQGSVTWLDYTLKHYISGNENWTEIKMLFVCFPLLHCSALRYIKQQQINNSGLVHILKE